MTTVVPVGATDTVRLTEIGELTALAYLADGLIDSSHPYLPKLKDAQARAEHADLLMAADGDEAQGAAVGTITVIRAGSPVSIVAQNDEFELRMLAVSPLARGRGIGKLLARAGMDLAVEQGAERIVMLTMEPMDAAHRLYAQVGFEREPSLDIVKDGINRLGYAWHKG